MPLRLPHNPLQGWQIRATPPIKSSKEEERYLRQHGHFAWVRVLSVVPGSLSYHSHDRIYAFQMFEFTGEALFANEQPPYIDQNALTNRRHVEFKGYIQNLYFSLIEPGCWAACMIAQKEDHLIVRSHALVHPSGQSAMIRPIA